MVDDSRSRQTTQARPRYMLQELLAQCDGAADASAEDREWLDNGPVGGELL